MRAFVVAACVLGLAACNNDPSKDKAQAAVSEPAAAPSAIPPAPVNGANYAFSQADSSVEFVGAKVTQVRVSVQRLGLGLRGACGACGWASALAFAPARRAPLPRKRCTLPPAPAPAPALAPACRVQLQSPRVQPCPGTRRLSATGG